MSSKSPEIRFNGFTDDWEQRKFTDIMYRVRTSSNSNKLPKVEFEDITSGEGRLNKDVSHKFDTRKGTLFKPNNILFGKLRPYLKNWLLPDFEGIALGDFWVFESKNSDAHFNYFLIQAARYQKVANDTSGTKMPRSDWKQVSTTLFSIPSFEEQIKIGSFLKQIEKTIALHQRELDNLIKSKKGFLQKMFPKKGEKNPKIRFEKFSDDWKLYKLGDLLAERNEQITENDEYPLMSFVQKTGVTPKGDRYDRSFLVKEISKKYKKTELGDFIYSSNNLETGSIGFNRTGSAVISPVYSIFSSKSQRESELIGIISQRKEFVNKMIRFRQGVTYGQWRIHEKDFLEITLHIPEKEEQEVIIDFFKNLDKTIAYSQQQLETLKQTKKAFLQKMFV
ncbi:type I restriction-modification system specificity subunit S [Marinilactibacillus psychrotolerans]|uniref:restriction endonuclease subunit S n=1 Tax=Marinilactibacillus psychrotolerans TaxID=191770 RepID=UPI001C7DBA5D|nr:restriction endonuclease subunit S [Marinilactibacillus psychrotolerans]GEQ32633.1 type I restriction-modification system specificity subunit S [Marinilactibacillus psychrotolerans]